ncbi:MAG: enolase C-terminal domain-like protein, partial [Elusimicrobiota bacterium]
PPLKGLQAVSKSFLKIIPCSAKAGVEMALLDAWARSRRIPLRVLFGGTGETVITDVTIPIVSPEHAASAAKAAHRFGIRALKVKVGTDPDEDARRVQSAAIAGRPKSLIVDGNAGYSVSQALLLLRLLTKAGIRPDLFEQPVGKDDFEGLCAVSRKGGVPVAADESASSLEDILRLARMKAVQVINIKLMKSGVLGALEWARAARAAGLGLMIGGMIESRLAMACAAHLAAGFGGFRFVDLDTPLLLAKDPMAGGPRIGPGGLWDLSRVRSGHGVRPRAF